MFKSALALDHLDEKQRSSARRDTVALTNPPGPPERRKYADPAQQEKGDSTSSLLTHHDPKTFGKTASLMSMAQVGGDAEAPSA